MLDPKEKFSKQGLFKEGWANLYGDMIEYRNASNDGTVVRVDAANMTLHTDFEQHKGDVINFIPPQKAGEMVSRAFLHCVMVGLHQSPAIVPSPDLERSHGVMTANEVSCLVIPDRCLGLPTLAALEQGIPTIVVADRKNLMANDIKALPWAPGQLHLASNYFEAAGLASAIRAGVAIDTLQRPITGTHLTYL